MHVSGAKGWILKGYDKTLNPVNWLGTPHDFLEHFPGEKITKIENEIKAFGAMMYIRSNLWPARADLLGEELFRLIYEVKKDEEGINLEEPIKYIKLEESSDIKQLIELTKSACIQFSDLGYKNIKELKDKFFKWLCIGYKQAKDLYKDQAKIGGVFESIYNFIQFMWWDFETKDRLILFYDTEKFEGTLMHKKRNKKNPEKLIKL